MRLRVGSRRSRLARVQTAQVCRALCARVAGLVCESTLLDTSGDRIRDRALRDLGGKGLFVKELDDALLDGRIDCAVHSLKDVPTDLPDGIVVAGVPERERPHDLLLSLDGGALEDLPDGAVVGTASPRRAAQALTANPALRVQLLRGNVETRLRRLEAGDFRATFLAAAGLARLGTELDRVRSLELDPTRFVPAPGQGALCFTARAGDDATLEALAAIDHGPSRAAVEAERSAARELGGSCFLPVGAYASVDGDDLDLVVVVASPDGRAVVRRRRRGTLAGASDLGTELGRELLANGGAEIVAEVVGRR